MKKLFYTFLLVICSLIIFTSCTDEGDVKPSVELSNGGGGPSDPGGK